MDKKAYITRLNNDQDLAYSLKISKRSKRLRLAVYCDGSVVVAAPKWIGKETIDKFIFEKSQWLIDKISRFQSIGFRPRYKNNKSEYYKYRQQALLLAEEKVRFFNLLYNFKYNKINIRNQKTRWGSCSKKGNLNFNYKIALLPEHLVDYVIVHELCHLKEFNHSDRFWRLVSESIPSCLDRRRELKSHI